MDLKNYKAWVPASGDPVNLEYKNKFSKTLHRWKTRELTDLKTIFICRIMVQLSDFVSSGYSSCIPGHAEWTSINPRSRFEYIVMVFILVTTNFIKSEYFISVFNLPPNLRNVLATLGRESFSQNNRITSTTGYLVLCKLGYWTSGCQLALLNRVRTKLRSKLGSNIGVIVLAKNVSRLLRW